MVYYYRILLLLEHIIILIVIIFYNIFLILDSFVNSQEWTLSRAVPDLRLGIVGSLSSGKSALVHRYLTGSYMQVRSVVTEAFRAMGHNGHTLLMNQIKGGHMSPTFSLIRMKFKIAVSTLIKKTFMRCIGEKRQN